MCKCRKHTRTHTHWCWRKCLCRAEKRNWKFIWEILKLMNVKQLNIAFTKTKKGGEGGKAPAPFCMQIKLSQHSHQLTHLNIFI